MERLLEKSLDDQFAMERERRSAQALLNRRLLWIMFPLGTAFAVAAYYLDISTRVAVPVLAELQQELLYYDPRPDYDVFRLNLSAFIRLLPSALIAGTLGIWVSVYVVTYNGRKFLTWMYAPIAVIYAMTFTAMLGLLIPLNVWILNKSELSITDSEIPFSDEITSFGDVVFVFPYSYLVTGMERGLWAAAALIILSALGTRRAAGGWTCYIATDDPSCLRKCGDRGDICRNVAVWTDRTSPVLVQSVRPATCSYERHPATGNFGRNSAVIVRITRSMLAPTPFRRVHLRGN